VLKLAGGTAVADSLTQVEGNMPIDWNYKRSKRFTDDRPTEWPQGVRGISQQGLDLLGIHEQTGKLFWDGKELVTRTRLRLGWFGGLMAFFTGVGALGAFLVALADLMHRW
jgi:hypothetical protein